MGASRSVVSLPPGPHARPANPGPCSSSSLCSRPVEGRRAARGGQSASARAAGVPCPWHHLQYQMQLQQLSSDSLTWVRTGNLGSLLPSPRHARTPGASLQPNRCRQPVAHPERGLRGENR